MQLFIATITFGQLNLPLKFKDYEPQWIDFVHLDHYPVNSNCHYNLRSYPKLIDDNIFIFYNVKNYGNNGIIVEKRNIDSGIIDWRFYRDTLVEKARIAISQVYMDNNIDLVLFDEDKYIDDTSIPDWVGSHPAELELDKDDGDIIREYHTDHSDQNNILLRTIGNSFQDDFNTSLKLVKTTKGYKQIYYLKTQKKYYITDIDSLGHLIKYDTLFLPTVYKNFSHRLFDLNDSTFISIITSTSESGVYDDRIQIMYRKMDHDLNILKEIDITHQIPDLMKSAYCYRADNGYFIIGSGFQAEDNSYAHIRYYLFDSDGLLKDRIVHTLTAEEEVEYGWLYPIVDIENERLILAHSRQDTRETGTYFELFTSNGDNLDLMRRFEVVGIEDHFRVQYGTMLPSGDLLLYFRQFDWDTQMGYPTPFYWHCWMLLDKEDLVNVTSTEIVKSDLILYPNPTDGKVNIKSEKLVKSVLVFTNNGENIGNHNNIDNIDLSGYPPGIYTVMIEQENGAILFKRIVVGK